MLSPPGVLIHVTGYRLSIKSEMVAPGQAVQANLQDFIVQNIAKLFSW